MMAHGLAEAGCAVLLAARRRDGLAAVAAAIEAGGGRALAQPADLREPGHREALVAAAAAAFGRLDGVVLNAATSAIGPAEGEDATAFDDVMRVNVGAQAAWRARARGP